MSPQTRNFLDQNRTYVSLGILIVAITTAIMVGRLMAQQEQLIPIINKFEDLQLQVANLKGDLGHLEGNVLDLENNIKDIHTQLGFYNVEIKKP